MKVLRGHEASLESSKDFYKGSKSFITVMEHYDSRPTNIYENLYKSMKIYQNPCNKMKVLRGQEANLESSKAFYKGGRS